jgi:beta-glucanase (GH16 family)
MKTFNNLECSKLVYYIGFVMSVLYIGNAPLFSIAQAQTPHIQDDIQKSWQLVWFDEFEGKTIDANKWSHVVDCKGGGNKEQQCYTDRKSNAFVKDGILNIVARHNMSFDQEHINNEATNKNTLPYTSAKLQTMHKGDWQYGRFEIRAKLPFGQGTWPAIWMLPTDYVYGGWAASGEIDIVEAANLKTPSDADDAVEGELESRIHGTLHFGEAWPNNVHSGTAYKLEQSMNPADAFHTYAIEWQEDEIRWYVDDIHYATQRESGWYSKYMLDDKLVVGKGSAPYNQKFHLILNLAVGGAWASKVNNKGIDESIFPQVLEVDFVRVYQCKLSKSSGKGCETIGDNPTFVAGHKLIIPEKDFAPKPIYHLYQSTFSQNTIYKTPLNKGLLFNTYNPSDTISYQEIELESTNIVAISQSGNSGNIAIQYPAHVDLSDWFDKGQLVFDIKVIRQEKNSELFVKMGSGWPRVSDIKLSHLKLGQWQQISLNIAELINSANSHYSDPLAKASINNIFSLFVIEPKGNIEFLIKNIRYEMP